MSRLMIPFILLCVAGSAGVGPASKPASTTRPAPFGAAVRSPVVVGASVAHPDKSRKPPAQAAQKGQPAQAAVADAPSDDDKEILIIQALEQPTSLSVVDAPIGESIRMLSEQTGVPIDFDQFVLGCLPYGSQTRESVTIENRPLKESLTALLQPLACKYVLQGDKVLIQPRPALFRICRRATWDEVGLIEKLYSSAWNKELADSLEFQFQDMSTEDAVANRKKIYQLAASVGSGHAARVLEYACSQYGWQWYPEGKAITFCTAARQADRQLERNVSLHYSEVQLKELLLELVAQANLKLKMEPGVLASLPTQQSERYRLIIDNVTIRQALELIMGETGLAYFVEPDGIRIAASTFGPSSTGSSANDAAAQAAALAAMKNANPIVGQITIPGENGITFSFFLREQDLPPDVNQLRLQQLREAANKMRDALSTRPVE